MDLIYYFTESGQQRGPVAMNWLLKQQLPDSTKVWKEGLPTWITLGELLGKTAETVSKPTPPPAPKPAPVTNPDEEDTKTRISRISPFVSSSDPILTPQNDDTAGTPPQWQNPRPISPFAQQAAPSPGNKWKTAAIVAIVFLVICLAVGGYFIYMNQAANASGHFIDTNF